MAQATAIRLTGEDLRIDDVWAVVRTGLTRSEHLVPLTNAYVGVDGNVVVPYDKNTVKRAPRAREHIAGGVVDVDHRGAALAAAGQGFEQAALGAPVVIHVGVEVEVVVAEIGEHRDVELDLRNAAQLERV